MNLRYILEFELRPYCWIEGKDLGSWRIRDDFQISSQKN